MSVFIFLIITIFALRIVFSHQEPGTLQRKLYCGSIAFALFLIAALRHYTVGVDVAVYVDQFYRLQRMGWNTISFSKDPIYGYFVKLITYVSSNHQVYLAIISAIFAFSIALFIYRFSDEPMISFFLLLPLSHFYLSMALFRQTVALSILLFAYKYLKERRLLKFVSIVVIASLFHLTALIFVLAYFLPNLKISTLRYLLLSGVLLILFYTFRIQILNFLINLVSTRGYSMISSDEGLTTLASFLFIFLGSLFFRRDVLKKDPEAGFLYNMMIWSIAFQMLVPLSPTIFRASVYFNIFNIILIPKVVAAIKERELRLIGYLVLLGIFGIQYFVFTSKGAGIYPYRFFFS